jgi:hypothetical protein
MTFLTASLLRRRPLATPAIPLAAALLLVALGSPARAFWDPRDPGYRRLNPGVEYQVRDWNGLGTVHAIRADLRDPRVHLRATKHEERNRTITGWAEHVPDLVAAINGDFGTGTPTPAGLAVADGRTWASDSRESFIGASRRFPDYIVTQHQFVPPEPLPPGGDYFRTLGVRDDDPSLHGLEWAIGGRPTVVQDGRNVAPDPHSNDRAWAQASQAWCSTQCDASGQACLCASYRRPAAGFRQLDGGRQVYFYLVVTDGALSYKQLGNLMIDLGATHAIAFDSDTSTYLWVHGQGVVNHGTPVHPLMNYLGITYYADPGRDAMRAGGGGGGGDGDGGVGWASPSDDGGAPAIADGGPAPTPIGDGGGVDGGVLADASAPPDATDPAPGTPARDEGWQSATPDAADSPGPTSGVSTGCSQAARSSSGEPFGPAIVLLAAGVGAGWLRRRRGAAAARAA